MPENPKKCESRFLDEGTVYQCALSDGHEAVHDSHPGVMKKGCLWRDEAAMRNRDLPEQTRAELGDGEPSPPPDDSLKLSAELKAARTAWHMSYGVPVSAEHARFMEAIGAVTDFLDSGAAQEVSPSANFVSEIRPRPDDPSCHVCGAQMVVKEWKCLSCGTTTGCSDGEVSPPSSDEDVCSCFARQQAACSTHPWHRPSYCQFNQVQDGGRPLTDSKESLASGAEEPVTSQSSTSHPDSPPTTEMPSIHTSLREKADRRTTDLERNFIWGDGGDTRELKAAARKFLKEVSAYADSDTLSDKALMIAAEEFGRLLG